MGRGRKGIRGKNNSPNYNSQGAGGNNGAYGGRREMPWGKSWGACVISCISVPALYCLKTVKDLHQLKSRKYIILPLSVRENGNSLAPESNNLNLVSAEQRPTLNMQAMHPIIISFKAFQPRIVWVTHSEAPSSSKRSQTSKGGLYYLPFQVHSTAQDALKACTWGRFKRAHSQWRKKGFYFKYQAVRQGGQGQRGSTDNDWG